MVKTTAIQVWQRVKSRATNYVAKRPHRSFRRTQKPRQKLGGQRLPTSRKLLAETWQALWTEKKYFIPIGLIYAVVTFLIVGGISQLDLIGLKEVTQDTFAGQLNMFGTATALFAATISGTIATTRTDLQQFLAIFMGFLLWLTIVWTARMRFANKPMKIRDAFYSAGAPLIPSFLIFLVIIMQLIPAAIGIFMYTMAQTTGLLTNGVEVMAFSVAAVLLCLLSLYWVVSSSLAMILVTLPNMYPWRALATASELVIGQRWALMLRLGVLAVVVFIFWVVILFPTLLLEGWLRFDWLPIVPVVVQLLSAASLVYCSLYVYKIYRNLL